MFFREKKSGPRSYLQIVENRREGKKTHQQVIVTLGRMDQLARKIHEKEWRNLPQPL